jgi:hypothetical protein
MVEGRERGLVEELALALADQVERAARSAIAEVAA